jgi:hypothetical protein
MTVPNNIVEVIQPSTNPVLNVSDSDLALTAFGDLRVAELTPIIQNSFEYTVDNTDITTNTTVAGGTVTQANAMAVVGTSTTTASTALLQSQRHAKYRAGLGGLMRFTTLFETSVADTEQYIGLADTSGSTAAFKNGYMVGFDGTAFGFHRFQNDTKISVPQSSWDDPLDGTGDSGVTLDTTKLNVWAIRYQYLGAGVIELWYEKPDNGHLVKVHTVNYPNTNTSPSVYNPNFHLTMWADNKATTTDLVIKSGSLAYFIEGKTKHYELHQPQYSSGTIELAGVTTELAVFTINNKSTYASLTNFIDILMELLSISVEASSANNLAKVRLVKNATLGGVPSYSDINTSNSVVEIDTAGTTVTGGVEVASLQLAGKNDRLLFDITRYDVILAPNESMTVAVSSANSATFDASLLWKELF